MFLLEKLKEIFFIHIELSFLLILLFTVVSVVYWSYRNGISPMPTSPKVRKILFPSLPVGVVGKVYDLGSGLGTLVFPLAKHYPCSQVTGYETSPLPYYLSKCRQLLNPLPNITLSRSNFYSIKLHDASLVICYLYPGAMKQLKIKFEQELKPGTWIISNTFTIPGWEPLEIIEVNDLYRTKIYIYRK